MMIRVTEFLRAVLDSRATLVAVITTALFMDEFLLTVVVPILPVVFLGECPQNGSAEAAVDGDGEAAAFGECEQAVNTRLGILLGSQFVVRVVMSFFGTYLCDRVGYPLMMLSGCALMIVSSVVYAFAESYSVYFIARMIHGFAAIPNDVGGLGFLAYRFSDNDETRGFILGLAISGFAAGSMVGPPFGGVVFFYLGKSAPFIILAGLLLILGLAEIAVFGREKTEHIKEDPKAVLKLLLDPLVLITVGAFGLGSVIFGVLQPSLPMWMTSTMDTQDWQLGVVFLPSGLAAIICNVMIGYIAYKIGRWLCMAIALVVMAISIAMIPFADSFTELIAPMAVFGFTFGTLDATACAIFNYLVEQRHQGAYGGAATLTVVTFCFGFVVGPTLSAALLNYTGFDWMLRGLAILLVIFAPFCAYLRNADRAPPSDVKEEKMALILPDHKPKMVPCEQTSP